MCLIIHKPAQQKLSEDIILDSYNHGQTDGWGIMYASGNDYVNVYHGMDINTCMEWVSIFPEDLELFIHLRYATHGSKDIFNCHPFQIGQSGIFMMHNGIIPGFGGNIRSDSAMFAEFLRPIVERNSECLFDVETQYLLTKMIGDSRIVFLYPDGRHVKIGNRAWIEWNGLEMSNDYAWSLHWRNDAAGGNWWQYYYSDHYREQEKISSTLKSTDTKEDMEAKKQKGDVEENVAGLKQNDDELPLEV